MAGSMAGAFEKIGINEDTFKVNFLDKYSESVDIISSFDFYHYINRYMPEVLNKYRHYNFSYGYGGRHGGSKKGKTGEADLMRRMTEGRGVAFIRSELPAILTECMIRKYRSGIVIWLLENGLNTMFTINVESQDMKYRECRSLDSKVRQVSIFHDEDFISILLKKQSDEATRKALGR